MLAKQFSAFLESFFDYDADSVHGRAGFARDLDQSLDGAAVREKIVYDEDVILRREKAFFDDDIVDLPVRVRAHDRGVGRSVQVFRLCFFREDDRNVKILRRDARDPDAGGFDRQDFRDRQMAEDAVEFPADFIQKFDVDLVIEIAVYFEDISRTDTSVAKNPFFQCVHHDLP